MENLLVHTTQKHPNSSTNSTPTVSRIASEATAVRKEVKYDSKSNCLLAEH